MKHNHLLSKRKILVILVSAVLLCFASCSQNQIHTDSSSIHNSSEYSCISSDDKSRPIDSSLSPQELSSNSESDSQLSSGVSDLYRVCWLDYDDTVICEEYYKYNEIPTFKQNNPERQSDRYGIYFFTGWDQALDPVTADTNFKAIYNVETSYVVQFIPRININTHVYPIRSYELIPENTKTAYSRDEYGNMTKDRSGEVNFEAIVDQNHVVGTVVVEGLFQDVTKVGIRNGFDIYRITGIQSDLTVSFLMKEKRYINHNLIKTLSHNVVGSKTYFSWQCDERVDHIDIYKNDVFVDTISYPEGATLFEYDINWGERTTFSFVPYDGENNLGWKISIPVYCMSDKSNLKIPEMNITTRDCVIPSAEYVVHPDNLAGHSIDNNEYVNAIIELNSSGGETIFSSTSVLNDPNDVYSGGQIKLRGNTSAYFNDKKPYKIKMNKKVDLLSSLYKHKKTNYRSKSWLLLNQGELLRYLFARETARYLGEEYDIKYYPVNVFMNGNYLGMYYLSDSANASSCNLTDTGFIVEHDPYWWKEKMFFSTPVTNLHERYNYTFKEPGGEGFDRTNPGYSYIKDYISRFETFLLRGDEEALKMIDVDSFVSWILTHDLLGVGDCEGSNRFLVKKDDENGKLKAGPSWDMETIFDAQYANSFSPIHDWEYWYFPYLFKYESFVNRYIEMFNEKKDGILSYIESIAAELELINMDTSVSLEHGYFGFYEQYEYYSNALQNRIDLIATLLEQYVD